MIQSISEDKFPPNSTPPWARHAHPPGYNPRQLALHLRTVRVFRVCSAYKYGLVDTCCNKHTYRPTIGWVPYLGEGSFYASTPTSL